MVNANIADKANVADTTNLMLWTGILKDGVVGLEVDYRNGTFKRLSSADGLSQGADFDSLSMYGGRRCCNVADDGTINAWYGDESYTEDGSNGQVMVYQPKFYYMVYPVETEPIDTGIGYHLRKANYYVSEKPRPGFRLHPAFYDAEGNEIEYFLTGVYEGSLYDMSDSAYLLNDEQVMDATVDKLSSIANAKPVSGIEQKLTRANLELMAQNRGTNWHEVSTKQIAAEQILIIIELGLMNSQNAIARGVVNIADDPLYNCSSLTGSTAAIGNGTGAAPQTINTKGDTTTTETEDGKVSVRWRGKENLWGNQWEHVNGINVFGNRSFNGGQPFVCNNFEFTEDKNSGNYEAAGFTLPNENGYISAMGYSKQCDWIFMASECKGTSALPVGDSTGFSENLNGYRIPRFGGHWSDTVGAGIFAFRPTIGQLYRSRDLGGRVSYTPIAGSAEYESSLESWRQQMNQSVSNE